MSDIQLFRLRQRMNVGASYAAVAVGALSLSYGLPRCKAIYSVRNHGTLCNASIELLQGQIAAA